MSVGDPENSRQGPSSSEDPEQDVDEDEAFVESSNPSSPILPRHAQLADSTEIREFDFDKSLNVILEDENKIHQSPSALRNNCPPSVTKKQRHYSTGNMDFIQRNHPWSTQSFSIDEDNKVCGFVQLYTLSESLEESDENPKEMEWHEISRWVKYEQDLEEGSDRLGKPHIAPMGHLFVTKLERLVSKSCIEMFDVPDTDMTGVCGRIVDLLSSKGYVDSGEGEEMLNDLLLNHRLVDDRRKARTTSASTTRTPLHRGVSLMERRESGERRASIHRRIVHEDSLKADSPSGEVQIEVCGTSPDIHFTKGRRSSALARFFSIDEFDIGGGGDTPFLRDQSESTIIKVRGGYKRRNGAIVWVRLNSPIVVEDVGHQFSIATRFILLLLSPTEFLEDFLELGRTLGTLMSNRKFYQGVQKACDSKTVVGVMRDFLDSSIVLPPGKWYTTNFYDLLPVHILEVKYDLICRQRVKDIQTRLERIGGPSVAEGLGTLPHSDSVPEGIVMKKDKIPSPFERTGKPFGGLVNDIRRRYPFYKSDILEGLNAQTLATIIFLYFASLAHNVTFGGLLEQKTKGMIGVPETLVAASMSGVIFSTLSGQPFCIIAPTGPLLVFDELLFKFMERQGIEFLPSRVWIGAWVVIFGLIVVGFEGSVVVKAITRFTMETFSALISVIFLYESIESLIHIYQTHPLSKPPISNISEETEDIINGHPTHEPNTALLSTFLMFGCYFLAIKLKHLRSSSFFPPKVRNILSDFSVPIGIVVMVGIHLWAGDVYVTTIKVPTGLQPTTPLVRGWLISPFGLSQPFNPWVPLLTIVPGGLVFLLMFLTVEICEKIIASRELRKGCGLHLDALILSLTNFICGLFGFPWVSVATLKALAHISALTVYSKNSAPGIPPSVVKVRENRVSPFVMSILIGFSIFMSPVLKLIPMCVLFGVFLYMGITSFIPTQLHDRLLLLLMPVEAHPQTIYVRRVPTVKIHLYTGIQILSLVALWAVKSIKQIALFFPLILLLLVPIRLSLKYLYTEGELEALDGEGPSTSKSGSGTNNNEGASK